MLIKDIKVQHIISLLRSERNDKCGNLSKKPITLRDKPTLPRVFRIPKHNRETRSTVQSQRSKVQSKARAKTVKGSGLPFQGLETGAGYRDWVPSCRSKCILPEQRYKAANQRSAPFTEQVSTP